MAIHYDEDKLEEVDGGGVADEEEDDFVDAGTPDAPDAGPVPASADIQQEREEQGQRDRDERHGDQEEDVVPEALP